MPNIARLQATMTHILDHPEEHEQGSWFCGTAACFAGLAVRLDGYSLYTFINKWGEDSALATKKGPKGLLIEGTIRDIAQDILGLDFAEAQVLFFGGNSTDALGEMVKDLSNGLALQQSWQKTLDDGALMGYQYVRRESA